MLRVNCKTNTGQKIEVSMSGHLLPRGDLVYYRLVKKSNGKYVAYTYGYRLRVKVTWSAKASKGYKAYKRTAWYRT